MSDDGNKNADVERAADQAAEAAEKAQEAADKAEEASDLAKGAARDAGDAALSYQSLGGDDEISPGRDVEQDSDQD
jgi:hypothetical protein